MANPPFGILDKSGHPDGSDVAVARQLAKDLGAEIDIVQVPSAGGILAQLADRADVTIASISVTADRANAVMFCNPNGALSITIFAPQGVNIKTPADLVGKRVGITSATLEEATAPKTPLLTMMQAKLPSRRCLLLVKERVHLKYDSVGVSNKRTGGKPIP